MARLCTIYALSDPRLERVFENVRYVGKTQNPLIHRLNGHRFVDGTTHKNQWIRSLKSAGLVPAIWPLAFCCAENWDEVERFWIAKLRAVANLTNVRDGGGSSVEWTDAMRAKASADAKLRDQKPISDEMREKARLAILGKKQDPDRIEARAAKLRGQKRSPEVIAKMKAIQSSRTWKTGGPCSDERKRKISESKKGTPMPENTKAALIKKNSVPVFCIDTGEAFPSSKIAANHVGVAHATMCRATLHGIPCRGMRWQKLTPCQEQP